MVTHGSMIADTSIMHLPELFVVTEETVVMTVLPFFHIYGQLIMMGGCLFQGSKLVVLRRFEPEKFLQAMQDHKVGSSLFFPSGGSNIDVLVAAQLRTVGPNTAGGIFVKVMTMGKKADLSKTYWKLKRKIWVAKHFAASNHNSKKVLK